jgi:hypothetical protein
MHHNRMAAVATHFHYRQHFIFIIPINDFHLRGTEVNYTSIPAAVIKFLHSYRGLHSQRSSFLPAVTTLNKQLPRKTYSIHFQYISWNSTEYYLPSHIFSRGTRYSSFPLSSAFYLTREVHVISFHPTTYLHCELHASTLILIIYSRFTSHKHCHSWRYLYGLVPTYELASYFKKLYAYFYQ